MKQIGIIGAGAAGLCALKHAVSTSGLSAIAWESQSEVGGTWLYTPKTGEDEFGLHIHSSMYNSLRTNLPKEIMKFPDFPFPQSEESFIRHYDVLNYLKSYANHFDLRPYIKFRHLVESVEAIPSEEGEACRWRVLVKNLLDQTSAWNTCDYLFICNGHVSVPNVAKIANIDRFSGKKMHSHYYREPSSFKNSSIAVLGARASGLDISLELSTVAKEVFVCHNLASPNKSKLPPNVHLRKGIREATEKGFILMDDTFIAVDMILYCTGYEYSFPFLKSSCGVTVENSIVRPLYKYVVNTTHPSMFFIGMASEICPFPFHDVQVRYCLKICTGSLVLPDKEAMDSETQRRFQEKTSNQDPRHFHVLGDEQWSYLDDLAEQAKVTPLEKFVELIYTDCRNHRRSNLMTYQRNRYEVTCPNSFVLDCRE